MSLDLGPALRAAFLDQQDPALVAIAQAITEKLSKYGASEEPAVFAYSPAPADAGDPIVVINGDVSITDDDGLTSDRPIVQRDIVVYGRKGPPGDASDQSPVVEAIGYMIRELFHRKKFSVQQPGYSVTEIIASGPVVAPVDDDGEVGRLVSLTIQLRRKP